MSEEAKTSTRSLRQRTSISNIQPKARRRSHKFELKEEPNVEDIYRQVNAKTEFNPSSLETIYESPKGKCQGLRDVMGVVKLKRHFRFTPYYNPSKIKIKMRKTKSKKLKRVGLNTSQDVKITLEQVEKALQQISEDENEENYQPKIKDNSTCCDLSKMKKCNLVNQEKLVPENMESISPMMVEIKEEPLVERKTPETKMEDYPQFESDWDSFSPGKQKIDKSKRNKRRSGRVQPLCLSNIFIDTSLIHIDKKICSDTTVESISKDDSAMQVDKNVSSIEYELQNTVSDTSKSFNGSRISTQTKPKRRNSGISKLIYRNTFVASPDSPVIFEEDENSDLENHINRRLLSPTLLLDQLSLCSPESVKKPGTNRTRRKSARLSFGGESKPHYGTLWMDSKSPKKNNNSNLNSQDTVSDSVASTNSVSVPTNSLETVTTHSDQAKECIDVDIGHVNEVRDQIKSKIQVDLSEVKKFDFGDSPILSGIIDCKARLNQNGKFQVRKGSKIRLEHFVSS